MINVTKLSKEGDKEENQYEEKLDGVDPVDNRPSTDQLQQIVKKKNKKKKLTGDT